MTEQAVELSEQQIEEYLNKHRNFFVGKDKLLSKMRIPHVTGSAVSLVERQLNIYREKHNQLDQHIHDMLTIARENDRLFEKTRRLVLDLLDVQSLDDVFLSLENSILYDFELSACSLLAFGISDDQPREHNQNSYMRIVLQSELPETLARWIATGQPYCGALDGDLAQYLFPHGADKIKSAAVTPIRRGHDLGIFALGSESEDRFSAGMGTMFLNYISDVLAQVLPRFVNNALDEL
ncbi:DUF484 family protein [Litoribacillus peritrichatus]|uniref:DUF484 family protein n=1 Tax=Litoribacillus peritrichatus TaxID=718191 RepID=A0ABP7NEQ4_9GAMM